MKTELVSVIIPIFNVEQFLDQCVESVINQTYKNLEIILVDDGSPDNCGKMCDEYAAQDNRIKVIHKQNGGLSDARNVGIDIATGNYITFIDSDDYVMPDMINILIRIIVNSYTDIAQCEFIRSKSGCVSESKQGAFQSEKFTVYSENKMAAYIKNKKFATAAWGKIYKKSLFNEIRFPVGRLHEDVFTTYKLIHKAESVAVTDYVGYVYRITENSITTSKFSPKKLDSVYGKLEQSEFIENNYPNLRKNAYSAIIYACNQCLLQMAKSRYKGKDEYAFLQKLYRQYGKHYICDKVSALGKVVAVLALINIYLAKSVLSLKG